MASLLSCQSARAAHAPLDSQSLKGKRAPSTRTRASGEPDAALYLVLGPLRATAASNRCPHSDTARQLAPTTHSMGHVPTRAFGGLEAEAALRPVLRVTEAHSMHARHAPRARESHAPSNLPRRIDAPSRKLKLAPTPLAAVRPTRLLTSSAGRRRSAHASATDPPLWNQTGSTSARAGDGLLAMSVRRVGDTTGATRHGRPPYRAGSRCDRLLLAANYPPCGCARRGAAERSANVLPSSPGLPRCRAAGPRPEANLPTDLFGEWCVLREPL